MLVSGIWLTSFQAHPPLSASTVSPKTDAAVGKKPSTNGNVMPAMPKLEEEDVAMNDIAPATNGAKRKTHSNRPSFAEPESSDDDKPLVRPYRNPVKRYLRNSG